MITDMLKLGRNKIPDSVVKSIRNDRAKGMTYKAISEKYGISKSYVRYLTMDADSRERWKKQMRENSHTYYLAHRDEILPRSVERQRINRSLKKEKLKKLENRKCFLGRSRSM